jgi:anti-sigma factor RsiW
MSCEAWQGKLDRYLDGELPGDETRAMNEHLRCCPDCSADALSRVQIKPAIHAAGKRFAPSPEFRQKMQRQFATKRSPWMRLNWIPAISVAAAAVAVALLWGYFGIQGARRQQALGELADLHVATLASGSPVDVVSSDRHTVKPWFQGKLPFSFDVPELTGTPFALIGGRMSYLAQSPAAQLLFRVRQHEVSVFIVQDKPEFRRMLRGNEDNKLSLHIESWQQNGLRYFAIGDVGWDDIRALSELMKKAAT